jgi:nucleoside-diphosphate-sugar epimerase
MRNLKILVTGGSGFIGTNLVEKFLKDGHDVLNIDIVKPKHDVFFKNWKDCDINNYSHFKECILKFAPDYIVHLAARTDLNGVTLENYNSNIVGVKNLLTISNELKSLKKILITSSMLVCKVGYCPKNQFDFCPTTVYGCSKVITEELVWKNKPFCDWAIIRPTSIWGPWFGIPYKNFFDLILKKKYYHFGYKAATKTYGYVGNSIHQINKLLFTETKNETKKVFYIGDNPPININDWANEIGSQSSVKILKMPFIIIKCAAMFGDFLKMFNLPFPINSFRLNNMTKDNIIELKNIYEIAPILPYTREQGIRITLKWIFESEQK